MLGAELVGDGDRAETVCDVELVDAPDGWCGDGVWCELAAVEGVAEGWAPAVPAAFAGAALYPWVMRSTIVACSNSANTPSICSIIRPAGEPVSNGSVAERSTTLRASNSSAMLAS